ncbi:MAG TPA: sialidase family protein [Gemmatimonadaceae bacterium]|nr:sialidase family protein [Gemmatimonadaceae bacterium]
MVRQFIRRLALTGAACGAALGAAPAQEAEPSPAGAGARFPWLASGPGGRVAMTWIERDADSVSSVKFALRGTNGAWSPARTVVRDSLLFVNFADHPSVLFLPSGDLVVHWLQRGGLKGKYDYGIRVVRSTDGGATWSAPVVPYPSHESGEHGFVSLWPAPGGAAALSFLNGVESGRPGGAMQLAFAALDRTGKVTDARTLDDRVCDCCQTAAALTARGPVVFYRDRSPEEIRDIYVTRLVRGAWSTPVPLARDGWKINACPVNGPAAAASGDRLVVVWFTAARDTAKVLVAFSTDAGATFGTPVRIDGGKPAGHVGIVLADDGSALVSWKERTAGDGAEVRVRRVLASGRSLAPRTIGAVTGLRPSGWPVMAAIRDGVLLAWTVPGQPTTIRLATVSLEGR